MLNKVYDNATRVPVDAPVGGSVSGKAYKVGELFGVAVSSVPFGKQYTLDREGVWRFKTEAQGAAITPGMKIYFEAGRADAEFHNDGTDVGSFRVGTALEAVATGQVKDILIAVEPCHNNIIA